jgi:hypothetical protein
MVNGERIACMETYSFELLFKTFDNETLPSPPVAQIRISNGRDGNYEKESGPYISHECLSYGELELEVGRLKGELDEILRKGRRHFKQAA